MPFGSRATLPGPRPSIQPMFVARRTASSSWRHPAPKRDWRVWRRTQFPDDPTNARSSRHSSRARIGVGNDLVLRIIGRRLALHVDASVRLDPDARYRPASTPVVRQALHFLGGLRPACSGWNSWVETAGSAPVGSARDPAVARSATRSAALAAWAGRVNGTGARRASIITGAVDFTSSDILGGGLGVTSSLDLEGGTKMAALAVPVTATRAKASARRFMEATS